MNYINTSHNINDLDTIWATTRKQWTVGLDGNPHSEIYVVAFDNETLTGLARSYTSGQWYAIQLTGRTVQHGQIRTALYPLRDWSLQEGTLIQGTERIGGRVASVFFFGVDIQKCLLDQ